MMRSGSRAEVMFMLISAGLFAYFGFGFSWVHQYTTSQPPQWLPMVAVLEWTLKGGAIVFVLSAVLAIAGVRLGLYLYTCAGLITAALFAIVALWDWTTPQYYSGIAPILLIIFAVWNGYSSWMSLQEALAARRRSGESASDAV